MINGSVPDLLGSRVECEYGPGVSTSATVHLDSGPAQIQTCPLLPRENYQSILPDTGESECRRLFWTHSRHISHHTTRVQFKRPSRIRANAISPFIFSKCTQKRSVARRWGHLARAVIASPVLDTCLHAFVCTDHQAVSVAIKVNGTSVVSGSFIIYDCERTGAIHPKTSWVLAAPSFWIASKFSSRQNHNKCAWQPLISHKKSKTKPNFQRVVIFLIFWGL